MDKVRHEPRRVKTEDKSFHNAKDHSRGETYRDAETISVHRNEEGHRLHVRYIHKAEFRRVETYAENRNKRKFSYIQRTLTHFLERGKNEHIDFAVYKGQRRNAETSGSKGFSVVFLSMRVFGNVDMSCVGC